MPPSEAEPLRFAVYGDMRGGHVVHGKIIKSLLEEAIDFVIVTGDLVLRGSDEADWQRFFDVAAPLLARFPYYPVAGNHDTGRTGDEELRMNEIFALWPGPGDRPSDGHWYSFEVAGVHFVMLDSNEYRNPMQRRWLQADLKAAQAAGSRAIFAAVHAGPYSRGLHQGSGYAAESYAPILAAHGVTLLFSGHDHLYQRGVVKGLHYMVSGGGGAPLYSVRCGVRGKKRCRADDGMQAVAKENHYILVTVYPKFVEACPKRVDRSPLEACIRYPLRAR
jgi:3',5'-cyclic AMP phosphodiesterase CpdA